MKASNHYYFYIGTEAELLKLLPVIRQFEKKGIAYKFIFSGQNKIENSHLFDLIKKKDPDIVITKKQLKQSILSLLTWFVWAFYRTLYALNSENHITKNKKLIVVQGDTLSTVIGSIAGKLMGFIVAHVESGYRSHNWFQPFPEEIDRVIVSYFADYHFYPSKDLFHNIKSRQGKKICTNFNTNIDCLDFASIKESHTSETNLKKKEKYFIFIMHRQENLINKKLVLNMLKTIDEISQDIRCIFVKHKYTDEAVRNFRFKGKVETIDKLPYFDFISLLRASEFILTDGGGNQQECYFLGKPCLILRKVTEGREGLGGNAMISGLDMNTVRKFSKNYKKFQTKRIIPPVSPSKIIVDTLTK